MAGVRRSIKFFFLFAFGTPLLATVTNVAHAQHCATSSPSYSSLLGVRLGIDSEFATYRTEQYEGDYQGIGVNIQWQHRWVKLRTRLLTYGLTRNGSDVSGIGDLLFDVKVPLVYLDKNTLALGIGMASTLPTGDASLDLGMGHVMLMPGLWLAWQSAQAFIHSQVAYGQALSSKDGAHHHGGGPGPIVNPMNASELEASLTGGLIISRHFRLCTGIYGAVPLATESGASRAVAFAGLEVTPIHWLDLSLEQHLPLVGDPFLAKIVLQAGARF